MDTSPLSDFFASLRTEGDLQQLIVDRVAEDLHTEFKTKKNSTTPELDDSDRRQFSRALSGFANSDGGILVWGIETDREDKAHKLKAIQGHVDFQARLKKSLLNAVQPSIDGVLIETIPSGSDTCAGYIKILVPSSLRAPHRAMLAEREYFKRSIEGFYRLEHFDLEDMFGRRPHPVLELRTRVVQRGSIGGTHMEWKGLAILSVENTGRGTARAPYLAVRVKSPYKVHRFGLDGNGNEGLPRLGNSDPSRVVYGGTTNIVIHPGVVLEIVGIEVAGYSDHQKRITMPEPLELEYELGADNTALVRSQLQVSREEIAKVVFPVGLYPG